MRTSLNEKIKNDEVKSNYYRPDAQGFDRVEIVTIPRYKQSGLSGDEWRISAEIRLSRNGRQVYERSFSNVQMAASALPYVIMEALDEGKGYFAGEELFCDQEGCAEQASVFYQVKEEVCDRCSERKLPEFGVKIRQFCDKHKIRGDAGLDDCDSNYDKI